MKKLLVSINSISNKGGGTLYLKTLLAEIGQKRDTVHLICKRIQAKSDNECVVKEFKYNYLVDLAARLLLSPTFLIFHYFEIFKISKKYEEIHFHSSRLIFIGALIKLFTHKRVTVHTDNVEYRLSYKLITKLRDVPIRLLDTVFLFFYEKVLIHFIDEVTCITLYDKEKLGHRNSYVIPVKIRAKEGLKIRELFEKRRFLKKRSVIFAGNFLHKPNVQAFKNICRFAAVLDNIEFKVAGRAATQLKTDLDNVYIYSDVSTKKLQELYLHSHLSLSLVNTGGGMKTKVAEAMAFNLPVVATQHSLIGYEKVLGSSLIIKINDKLDMDEVTASISAAMNIYDSENNSSVFIKYWEQFLANYKL